MEPLAAGDGEGGAGRLVEPKAESLRRLLHDLLEVVEDNKTAAVPGYRVAELNRGVILAERDLECGGDGEKDAVERSSLGEVAEVDAAGPVAEPDPTVARTKRVLPVPRSEDREQADACVEPCSKRTQLCGPADKRVAFGGKVLADLADGTPECRHVRGPRDRLCRYPQAGQKGKSPHSQLEDLDGLLDPLESVVAVPSIRSVWNRVGQRIPGSGTHQCLPPRPGHDACRNGLARPSTSMGFAPRPMSSSEFCEGDRAAWIPTRALSPRSATAW